MARTVGWGRQAAAVVAALGALWLAGCGGEKMCGAGCGGPACGDGVVAAAEACDDGNAAAGDGCSAACTVEAGFACAGSPSACQLLPPAGVDVVQCAALAPLAAGTCRVAAGGAGLLVEGTVLLPGRLLRGGQVAVDAAGVIACVGCDCAAAAPGATRVTCPRGVVSPGLVNAHDHLAFVQNGPFAATAERYEQRHDWRAGLRGHTAIPAAGGASADELRWGELRQLMAGTTSVLGATGAAGLLRNLDRLDLTEGLSGGVARQDNFPLGDSSGVQLTATCAYPSIATPASLAGAPAALLVVGEGIDGAARNELACLTSTDGGGQDLAAPQVAFVGGVAAGPQAWALLAARGTALVWSPRSNVALYGDTARVTEAVRAGVQVALGTDWVVTGSSTMLRELACADAWNRERLDGFFTDERLWRLATSEAADVAGALGQLGVLAPGRLADLVIFDGSAHHDYRAVLDAGPGDVALVLRGGRALHGEAGVVAALAGAGCDAQVVCGVPKLTCLQELGTSLAALQAANATRPPAFACGAPAGEPTCTPSRAVSVDGSTTYTGERTAADADGDGLPDAQDRCPTVFDPVRPVDGRQQPDLDGDGVGDACDPCPLLAGSLTCPAPDPGDLDGDGVANAVDSCPLVANPDQADADADGKGDACDPCPADPNPGSAACPVAIHAVKDGTVAPGQAVGLRGVLVTARADTGFFVQEKPGDPGYAGPDHSGLWVAAPDSAVAAGDRVSVLTAVVAEVLGQRLLTAPVVVVDASLGEAGPAPVAALPAELVAGGTRAAALEGVLVTVADVTVADAAPPPGPGEVAPTGEFEVDAGLRVDDLFHLAAPFPVVGQPYAAITGVLALRGGLSRLEPRAAADLVVGAPVLASLGPSTAWTRVGRAGQPTVPAALTVALSAPVAASTFVTVGSADPGSLAVVGGGVTVPAGQASAVVLLDGLAASPGVTLTATLGASARTASVAVLDGTEPVLVEGLAPAFARIVPGGAATLTVTLGIPAPPGGVAVGLAVAPAGAGSLPAAVTVPEDQRSASFDYLDAGAGTPATVTATLGASSASAELQAPAAHLVINEVDYDNVGTDTAEFVEILNPTGAPVSLAGLALVLVNGSDGLTYATVDLTPAGTLAAGQYLVVGSSTVTVPAGALKLTFEPPVPDVNALQNGTPDGIALVDAGAGLLLDALCYEGAITAATVAGLGTVSLVEGTPLAASVADSNTLPGSLARLPDGADTDDAAADWALTSTPTPGAPNAP